MTSIDTLLSRHAKHIKPGESLTFQLIKGSPSSNTDPLILQMTPAKRKEDKPPPPSSSSSSENQKSKKDKSLQFPRIAKFPVCVIKPNFTSDVPSYLYEQYVPKPKDDSDEEEDDPPHQNHHTTNSNGDGSNNANSSSSDPNNTSGGGDGTSSSAPNPPAGGLSAAAMMMMQPRKKKKKWGSRYVEPERQWIVESKTEFYENMAHKERYISKNLIPPARPQRKVVSRTRYEGAVEANHSYYILLSVDTSAPTQGGTATSSGGENGGGSHEDLRLKVTPIQGFHAFSQPNRTKTLSMQEAEDAINNQRANTSRFMMHGAMKNSRGGNEDEDDIMSDIAFRNGKGGGGARQELLQSLGDGLKVDDDGVVGGANDAEFGGKRSFGQFSAKKKKNDGDDDDGEGGRGKKGQKGESGGNSSTMDGNAMADDFYQRDVGAEYEDLDYDANEQFDDDDVDHMEAPDPSGYGGEVDDDDMDDDDDDEPGSEGIATSSGLKQFLAKARGEQVDDTANGGSGTTDARGKKTTAYNREEPINPIPPTAAPATSGGPSNGNNAEGVAEPNKKKRKTARTTYDGANENKEEPEYDENGQRIISLASVRREIWLHHGQIKTNNLLKLFKIKKKSSPERRELLFKHIKELCTIRQTNEGNFLVLKQHYSNL